MKKKSSFFLLLIAMIIILAFSACSGLSFLRKQDEKSFPQNEKVTLSIVDGTLSPAGATFLAENGSDETINCNPAYRLQIKKHDRWQDLSPIRDYDDPEAMVIEVPPDSELSREINWSSLYSRLGTGEYRIIVRYNTKSVPEDPNDYYMVCAFSID